ncbi:MAG: DUF6320 domain-containing protein [Lachnospiraceae bacterium]|nr:DUF6320 domain-containing protein [Lachnospiraceae bacterium]
MSYCVNCGVELNDDLTFCPLCNTPVINPSVIPLPDEEKPSAFPKEKGQVDVVKRKDLAILLSIVLSSTAVTCALLNFFVFNHVLWSIPIIGICVVVWVLMIPAVIYTKFTLYWSFFLDGIAVSCYLYALTFLTDSTDWFLYLGMPIVILLTLLIEIFLFLIVHLPVSFVTTALYLFAEIPVFCVCLELLIRNFIEKALGISWSAIVLTICSIIIIALITLLSRVRLRNAVRRRLHF